MMVHVLLFAQARQLAGNDRIEVKLDSVSPSVAELKQAIANQCPAIETLLLRSNIAIDQQYATDSDLVSESAEIAMIPPVSGG